MSTKLHELFPNASAAFLKLNAAHHPERAAPIAQPPAGNGPLAASKTQKPDPAFYVVRYRSFRVRLLDTDNLVGKWHTDALRYAALISGDDPTRARIETSQEKVGTKAEEHTEIEITRFASREEEARHVRRALALKP